MRRKISCKKVQHVATYTRKTSWTRNVKLGNTETGVNTICSLGFLDIE